MQQTEEDGASGGEQRGDGYESLGKEEDLTDEEEQEEGERHQEELLSDYPPWDDEEVELYLEDIFHHLEPHMHRTEIPYRLQALDSEIPFASSCPNGMIYFSRCLLEELNQEQVLFFAAHELAHTEMRHYATRKRRLSELRQIIPAPIGSSARQRLEVAAVLCVRHQEEFEADARAALWVGTELADSSLSTLFELCRTCAPASLKKPTHPPFPKRLANLAQAEPFPDPLGYLYSLV